jgi:hypothetical protein
MHSNVGELCDVDIELVDGEEGIDAADGASTIDVAVSLHGKKIPPSW